MTDCYGELVWQLIQGNATPTTFTNCAFDFQLWRPQPDFHIRSNANFINSILKFYGEEASHSLFVDGYCQFTQCVIGARGVFGPYTNGAGEQTERISLIDCTSTGQGWESNRISQTKTRGNQLLGTNTNFMQSLGCPVEGNRVSGTAGIIEVFNQPLYNTQAYGSTPLKVSTITNEAYLVSSSARGKVAVGDVLTSYTNFPVKTIPVDISSQKTPLGTVESVSGDTIFLKYNSIPFTLKDTTIGTWLNMYLPGSNLPFIGSGISGNTYLIVKTPWQFVGSLRPNGPGISPGTYVTRVSASNDTLHLSTALTSTVTNGYYSFFNSRKTGVDRSNEELVYNIGDEVVENGTKYIVTVPGKVGTSVPPTFTPALSAGSSLTADQVAIGNGSSNPLTGSSNVVYTGGQFRIGNPTSDGFTSLQVNGQTNVKRGFYVDRTAGNLASYYNILVRDAGEAGGLGTGLLGQTEMFAYNTGGLAIGTHNGGPLVLASAGTPRMTLNTTGVIDIGTSILKASSPTGTAMFVAEKAGASENKAAISDEGLYLSRTSDGGYLGFVGRDPNWSTPGNGDVVIRYSAARHYFYHANSGALLMSIMPGTNPITTSVDAIMSISHVQFKNFIGLSNEAPYFYSDDATGSTTNGFTFERSNRAASGNAGIVTWKFSGSEMARLTTSGSLALGTNAPVAKLHVVGDCVITSSLWLNDTKTVGLLVGTGSPEGAVTASVGSTFSRTDGGAGTSFYVKESGSGNTGWIAK
jgi:hypothetical protein